MVTRGPAVITVKAVIFYLANFYAFPSLFPFLFPKRSRSLYARGVMERREKRCGWKITAFTAITAGRVTTVNKWKMRGIPQSN